MVIHVESNIILSILWSPSRSRTITPMTPMSTNQIGKVSSPSREKEDLSLGPIFVKSDERI